MRAQKTRCWGIRAIAATVAAAVLTFTMGIAVMSIVGSSVPGTAHADTIGHAASFAWNKDYTDADCYKNKAGFIIAANFWRDEMMQHIWTGNLDTYIMWEELADDAYGGEDDISANFDTADIVFLGAHGATKWNQSTKTCGATSSCVALKWAARISTDDSSPTGCKFWTDKMLLGNDGTEIADIYGCNSNPATLRNHLNWHSPYLHQWHGFYGTTSTAGPRAKLDDYIEDSFDGEAAGLSWVEHMTKYDAWGGPKDICGATLVIGDSEWDAIDRLFNESYPNLRDDPTSGGRVWYYICGCDSPHPNGPYC